MSNKKRIARKPQLPGQASPPPEVKSLELGNQIAALRARHGLSQAGLAAKIGTKQAGVARMERASYFGYTVGTLAKIAAATGATLQIRLVPQGKPSGVAKRTRSTEETL